MESCFFIIRYMNNTFCEIMDLLALILTLGHIISKAVSLGAMFTPLSTLLVLQLAHSS